MSKHGKRTLSARTVTLPKLWFRSARRGRRMATDRSPQTGPHDI